MFRARTLPVLLCIAAAGCFNPPNTPLSDDGTSTSEGGGTSTTGIVADTSTSTSVGPTTEPDPDTTIAPPESTSSESGGSTTGGEPEIEVTIDGVAIATGESFELVDTVAVDAQGPAVTVTVENTGAGDLLIGGVLAMGPDAAQVTIDQAGLAASIAPGESSSFTVRLTPSNGGSKQALLNIANDDADESPYEITLRGHTTENTYRLVTTMGSPSPRFNATLVDLGDGRLLLFGGRDATGTWLGDTWVFEVETSTWTQLTPATSPPARNAHAMALVEPGTVVLFGGTATGGGGGLADTWSFDVAAEEWTQLAPPLSPPPRFQHEMVAIGNAQALVFGGRPNGGGSETADTWRFDAASGTWTNLSPGGGATAASAYAMAWDGNDVVTRFGGFVSNNPLDQTWNYTISTNTWALAAPMGTPGPRGVLSGEYLADGRMVVFSGKLGNCCIDPTGGTFAYDRVGNAWATITPPGEPSPRFNYAMAAVSGGNKAILFGGLLTNTGIGTAQGQTWEYVGVRP